MSKTFISSGILGIGSSVPEKILTNKDLEKMVETSDEWIVKRTGISQRRILSEEEPTYKLGVEAALKALNSAGISPEEIDLILVSTSSPDYLVPSTACIIQKEIKAVNAAAMDINAACSGFIYGITTAQQYISTGFYKNILLVGCEGLSKATDWKDRRTCVLFGDAAGAVVLGPVEDGYGILQSHMGADGNMRECLTLPCFHMNENDSAVRLNENKRVLFQNGPAVFKFAVRILEKAVNKVLVKAGLTLDDIKYIIPHQANQRIIDAAESALDLPDGKMVSVVANYGNTSSASIPLALEEIVNSKKLSKGDNIILVGFGGGLTWASSLIKWSK